jgi:hypothetical protein
MILNRDSLLQAHVLTYCEDSQESILYITQATSQQIDWIYLKDHNCEDCFQESFQKKAENVLNTSIVNLMKQFFSKVKGRTIQSRRKNNVNMLQTNITKAYS